MSDQKRKDGVQSLARSKQTKSIQKICLFCIAIHRNCMFMQSLFLFPRQFLSVKGTFQTQTRVCFGFLSSGCCLKQTLLWSPSLQKNKMFHILSPTVVPSIHRTSKNPVNTRVPTGTNEIVSYKSLLSDNSRNAHFTGFFQQTQIRCPQHFLSNKDSIFNKNWEQPPLLPLFLPQKLGFASTLNNFQTSVRSSRTSVPHKSNQKERSFDNNGDKKMCFCPISVCFYPIFVPKRVFFRKNSIFCQSGEWAFLDL